MDRAIETFEHAGFRIAIYPDDSPESPREWDELGTFYMARSSHQIQPDGDADDGIAYNYDAYKDGEYPDDMPGKIDAHRKIGSVVIPVRYDSYMGGVDECDDADADGYYYATREKIAAERPDWKRLTAKRRAHVETVLRGEIEVYNQWAQGDVYGYVIKDETGAHVDSLWGCYGLDYTIEEAKRAADSERADRDTQRAERLSRHNAIHAATCGFWYPAFL